MKTIFLLFAMTILLLFACNKKENMNKSNVDDIENKQEIEEQKLIKNALEQGDTLSYKKAFKIYILSDRYNEFLFYSIRMSELHNFSQADFDAYELLTIIEDKDGLENLRKSNLALFYLLKAYEKGNKNASAEINEIYKDKSLIPNSDSFRSKI